ncbi:MAG TPA: hypothetical protein VFL83_06465 [Anaeromyxobacter sp.]|nr:hypothetical protein [Anaeromyxobacter sp.]
MQALACLAAVATAAAPTPVSLGAGPLPVEIAVEARTSTRASSPALGWRTRADGVAEGRGAGPGYEALVELLPAPGGARRLQATVHWLAPAEVERVALRLSWPGAARALGRDLAFGPLRSPRRTGRGTPLLVAAGRAVLAGGAGIAAAILEPVKGGVRATLLLDDADERPFSTYETCLEHLPAAEAERVPWAALEVRRAVRYAPRAAGATDEARATLYPAGEAFRPVVVERWPAGARAAVVLTDHADRTDPAALRAVLWGSSDPRAEGGVGAGLLGRGLKLTRTFFAHSRRGGALDDPEIQILAEELEASGSEVALHSATPERDDREAVREGLAAARPFRPATWVDHQPYTNCEALSSRGAGDAAPWGVRDLLEAVGVRWAWAAGDVDGRAGTRVVNLLGGDPAAPRPAIFPLPDDPRIWIFRSSMFHAPPQVLAAALSEAALAALERERGLFVAHTYLGPSPRTTRSEDQRARLVVVEEGGGLVLHPAVDRAFARLAAHVRAGRLASLAWAEAGDRLRALGDVEVVYRPDGAAEVVNRGADAIRALTVSLPAAGLDVALEGAALLGREDDDGSARLWFDLDAGERVVLRVSDGLVPVALLPFR